MSESELSKEEQILRMVKKVLTDVAKDTHVKPGLRHPLSDNTILGIRECLSLITAREQELAKEAGRESRMRPRFVDEPQDKVVVSIDKLKRPDSEQKD
jgi:DNA uptake protein ComE-like DNA-binding protein